LEILNNSEGKAGGTVVGGLVGVYTGKGKSTPVSEQICIADVPQEYKVEHKRGTNECDAAKQAVVSAMTEDEMNII
jgi:hypothetical protein